MYLFFSLHFHLKYYKPTSRKDSSGVGKIIGKSSLSSSLRVSPAEKMHKSKEDLKLVDLESDEEADGVYYL